MEPESEFVVSLFDFVLCLSFSSQFQLLEVQSTGLLNIWVLTWLAVFCRPNTCKDILLISFQLRKSWRKGWRLHRPRKGFCPFSFCLQACCPDSEQDCVLGGRVDGARSCGRRFPYQHGLYFDGAGGGGGGAAVWQNFSF